MKGLKGKVVSFTTVFIMVFVLASAMVPMQDVKAASHTFYIDTDGEIRSTESENTIVEIIMEGEYGVDYAVDPKTKEIAFVDLDIEYMGTKDASTGWTFIFSGSNVLYTHFDIRHSINIKVNTGGVVNIFCIDFSHPVGGRGLFC